MRCYRKILHISYKVHVTNKEAIGPHEDLTIVKTHKLQCTVMFPVHQVWPKPSCKAQWKGEEDKANRGRGRKTTSGNGQAWSSASPKGQWRTGKNGENWLQNQQWCPNDPHSKGLMMMMIMYIPVQYDLQCSNSANHTHSSSATKEAVLSLVTVKQERGCRYSATRD